MKFKGPGMNTQKKFSISTDWRLFWFYLGMLLLIGALIFLVEGMILIEDVMCQGRTPGDG